MILIDTSAWVEFFRKSGDKRVKQRVADYLKADKAAYTCSVYFELLSGARDKEKDLIKEAFSFCERFIFKPEYWEKAAALEQKLRKKGITIPRDDLFVATTAIEENLSLLCQDKHFDIIREKAHISFKVEQIS